MAESVNNKRTGTLTLAICARNAQEIIGRCLQSIANQSVQPDVVLVAVDEESDPTAEVARRHGAEVIASGATGLYEARNAVLKHCRTELLAFTDADCVLDADWVRHAKRALAEHDDVAAGTGPHPPIGKRNFAAWLHHMWFLVETRRSGYTDGVIGGNSYFRAGVLREVGGWLPLKRHSAAEDVYISKRILAAGHKIWFDEKVIANHSYEARLGGLCRKAVMMGRDIVVMMKRANYRDALWWYTLTIPVVALAGLGSLVLLALIPWIGAIAAAFVFLGTLAYLICKLRSLSQALPRWIARWVFIWPYSWGILQGLLRGK